MYLTTAVLNIIVNLPGACNVKGVEITTGQKEIAVLKMHISVDSLNFMRTYISPYKNHIRLFQELLFKLNSSLSRYQSLFTVHCMYCETVHTHCRISDQAHIYYSHSLYHLTFKSFGAIN